MLHMTPALAGILGWIALGVFVAMAATYWWGFWNGLRYRSRGR